MIDLYFWPTPNGHKISIMFEEIGLPYKVIPVNIGKGDQFKPEFLKISPNNRMPAIVDHDAPGGPLSIFESGAILMYLAEKSGKLMPTELRKRYDVLQWLFWQVGGVGPMAGQANHFKSYAPEKIPYAIDRYIKEVNRLLGVLNRRLADREYLAGEYSIADIATWPWLQGYGRLDLTLDEFPHTARWMKAIGDRPAVQRGIAVGKELRSSAPTDDAQKKVLFGQTAASVNEAEKKSKS